MQLALIPPISLLHYTKTTKYQLMLPQLVEHKAYADVYNELSMDSKQFVILDNGAAEGVAFDWEKLIDIAYDFGVNEIVIPDIMTNMEQTIEKAKEFHDFFTRHHPQARWQHLSDFQFMFVVQGTTYEEVYESAKWAACESWITTLGIPRHLPSTLADGRARIRIANEITAMNCNKDIHFLGANPKWPHEMRSLGTSSVTNQTYVRGMDTSLPFNYAYRRKVTGQGVRLAKDPDREITRPEDYFILSRDYFDEEAVNWNVSVLDKYKDGLGPHWVPGWR